MPQRHGTQNHLTYDTTALENALITACNGNLQIRHRLELRALALSLRYDAEIKKQGVAQQMLCSQLPLHKGLLAQLKTRLAVHLWGALVYS